MELLFARYTAPYLLLDEMLSAGRFVDFVYTLADTENDRKLWDIYLSCLANPYAETGSFADFKDKNTIKPTPDKGDLEAIVNDSYEISKNFNPES